MNHEHEPLPEPQADLGKHIEIYEPYNKIYSMPIDSLPPEIQAQIQADPHSPRIIYRDADGVLRQITNFFKLVIEWGNLEHRSVFTYSAPVMLEDTYAEIKGPGVDLDLAPGVVIALMSRRPDGERVFLTVTQKRPQLPSPSIIFPQGSIRDDESIIAAAKRELREEGYGATARPESWDALEQIPRDVSFTTEASNVTYMLAESALPEDYILQCPEQEYDEAISNPTWRTLKELIELKDRIEDVRSRNMLLDLLVRFHGEQIKAIPSPYNQNHGPRE